MKSIFIILAICGSIGCRQERTVYRPWDGDRISLAAALMLYRETAGDYPTAGQGLSALSKRPADLPTEINWKRIMDNVPTNPWGHEYQYSPPDDGNPPTFELRDLGLDGVRSDDDVVATFRADTPTIKQIKQAGSGPRE